MDKEKKKKENNNEGKEAVLEFLDGFSKVLKKNEDKYIKEMVDNMFIQADIIQRARKDGVDIKKVMPKIKKEYEIKLTKKP